MLPRISYSLLSTCSPYPSRPKIFSCPRNRFSGTDSANIVGAHEASTSSSSSSTTDSVSLPFGAAYKSESVPRACCVSSSSKLVLRTTSTLTAPQRPAKSRIQLPIPLSTFPFTFLFVNPSIDVLCCTFFIMSV
jgi:hypothetical protein